MKPNLTSKVSVLVQGENSDGEIVDQNMDCNSVVVFGIREDGIEVTTFGAFSVLEAAHLANTMDGLKQDLFDQFPGAKLFATLASSEELQVLMSEEEDEEDE